MEDFVFDHKNGHRIRLVDRGELKNGAKLKTGEREIYVSQALMDLYDDYLYGKRLNIRLKFPIKRFERKFSNENFSTTEYGWIRVP
jgi:hypothetical protein